MAAFFRRLARLRLRSKTASRLLGLLGVLVISASLAVDTLTDGRCGKLWQSAEGVVSGGCKATRLHRPLVEIAR